MSLKDRGNVEGFVRGLNSLCDHYGLFLTMGGLPLNICDVDGLETVAEVHENTIEDKPIYLLEDPEGEEDPDFELRLFREKK